MKNCGSKTMLICVALMLGCVTVQPASALSIGVDRLLGFAEPGTPSNESNAVNQVNFLIEAYNAGIATHTNLGDNSDDPQGEVHFLWFSDPASWPSDPATLIPDPVLPMVTTATKTDTENPNIDLGSMVYEWIVTKYGRDSYVYYIGDISGEIELPVSGWRNGSGLSHYALVESTTRVPDGGSTALLLGLACIALGSWRSRKR